MLKKEVTLREDQPAVILSWFTSTGKDVYDGLPVAIYQLDGSSEQLTFKAPCEGVVEYLHPHQIEVRVG